MATRRCVARLKDMTSEEIVDFFMTVCKCQRLLEEYYQTTSSTVTVQDGEFAGQTVRVIYTRKIWSVRSMVERLIISFLPFSTFTAM